jgi:Fic family protein
VAVLQILSEQALRAPVLAISPWLEQHADEYRDHLLAVSITGDWEPWISFLARAIRDEARAGHDRIMRLLDLRREIVDTVRSELPRARLALEIADDLIAYPMLSVAEAHRRYGRTNQANRNAINALVDVGVLETYGSSRYERLYWNRRVFQVVSR